ncbi:MAG: FliM/FliN family flagellar motor switch protein [Pirellulaceae bacterium]
MSEEEKTPDDEATAPDDAATEEASDEAAVSVEDQPEGGSADADAAPNVEEAEDDTPDFPDLSQAQPSPAANYEMNRFAGVQVVLTAELGRTKLTIHELMSLSEGAVLELDRAISAPVELVAQGVALGNGEVVVVDDRFAIRIKEIYQN